MSHDHPGPEAFQFVRAERRDPGHDDQRRHRELFTDASAQAQDVVSVALSTRERTIYVSWNTLPNMCAWCGNYYFEIENIGPWTCPQHDGRYDARKGHWLCCLDPVPPDDKNRALVGCVRAHHNSNRSPYDEVDDLRISRNLAAAADAYMDKRTQVPCSAVTPDADGQLPVEDYKCIRRFNAVDRSYVRIHHRRSSDVPTIRIFGYFS